MRVLPVLGLAVALSAQLPEEPTIRVTVANVLLDVVVTDRSGNPVAGLKPADFRITQDGKPRTVVSASLVELPRRAVAGAVPMPAAGTNQSPRTIAFVIDDLGLSLQSMHSVREGIRRFVDKQFQPTDRVAIIRTAGGISALQQFTSDPNLLRVAAARLRFNPASRVNSKTALA